MQEAFLHFLWQYQYFDRTSLKDVSGKPLGILKPGQLNRDAGPDFLNAMIERDGLKLAGNIEIHIQSGDWFRHKHHKDPAYENTILHVVLHHDRETVTYGGRVLPVLELAGRFDENLYSRYEQLLLSRYPVPCAGLFSLPPDITTSFWLSRLVAERLENRVEEILETTQKSGNDWEETFYQYLAMRYGTSVNNTGFQLLARSLPVKILLKHRDHLMQIEALLFGQSGLLAGRPQDDYEAALKKEYAFLRHKYGLQPIDASVWKFARLRPQNFPTLRIAQLAAFISQSGNLLDRALQCTTVPDLELWFQVTPSEYWKTHFRFGKATVQHGARPGKSFIHTLIINAVVPVLFAYGKYRQLPEIINRIFTILENMPAENNRISKTWLQLGLAARHASDTQAFLQLKKYYCDSFRCLECAFGHHLLKSS